MTAYAALAAQVIRENTEPREDTIDVWLADCDRTLGALEEANAEGATALSDEAREAVIELARRLGVLDSEPQPFQLFHAGRANDVQRAVDYVFDQLQDRAFGLKWPDFHEGDEDGGEVAEA